MTLQQRIKLSRHLIRSNNTLDLLDVLIAMQGVPTPISTIRNHLPLTHRQVVSAVENLRKYNFKVECVKLAQVGPQRISGYKLSEVQ